MKPNNLVRFFLTFSILITGISFTPFAYSQSNIHFEKGKYYHVEKRFGGDSFNGMYETQRDSMLIFIAKNKELPILRALVKSAVELDSTETAKLAGVVKIKEVEKDFDNPFPHQYLFNSSAFALPKGKTAYTNIGLSYNAINHGVSDHFSVGLSTDFASIIAKEPAAVLFARLNGFKLNEDLTFGTTFSYLIANNFKAPIIGAQITKGHANSNLTFSGYIMSSPTINFFSFDATTKSVPFFSISGMHRLSNRMMLLSENIFIPKANITLISAGVRWIWPTTKLDFLLYPIILVDEVRAASIMFSFGKIF